MLYQKKKKIILVHDRNVADFLHFSHYLLKLHYETMNTFLYLQKNHHSERKVLNNEARMKEKRDHFSLCHCFLKTIRDLES